MIQGHPLRSALRRLRRQPASSALAVAIVALGVGATTAVFALVSAVILQPLPFRDAASLWTPHLTTARGGAEATQAPFSWPKFETFRDSQEVFAELGAWTESHFNLTAGAEPERIAAEMVTPEYFAALDLAPLAGRLFAAGSEDRAGGERSAVLAEALWRRRYGADPAVLGRTIEIDRKPYTIVGVAPAGFAGLSSGAEIFLPLAQVPDLWGWPEALDNAGSHFLGAVARQRRGFARATVETGAEAAGRAVALAHPTPREYDNGTVWGAAALPLAEARSDEALRRALGVLLAAVVAVLLVACANVAGLELARAASRRRELSVRAALGAGRRDLALQVLAENALVAVAGGALGVALADRAVRGLLRLAPHALAGWGMGGADLASLGAAGLDLRVVAFALAATASAALLAGLIPALVAAGTDPGEALREGGGALAGAGGFGRHRARRLLVAAQAAAAVVLLVGAGLLLRSFVRLAGIDLGFRADGVLAVQLVPTTGDYDQAGAQRMHEELLAAIGALPGVESASIGTCAPVAGDSCNRTVVRRIEEQELPRAEAPEVGSHNAAPAYFRTLGIRVVAGREFTTADRDGAPRVAIVNESAARALWPGVDPLGRRLNIGMGMSREENAEVVGVVADVRYTTPEQAPKPEVYLADLQTGWAGGVLFVRTAGDPLALVPALRETIGRIDPSMPLVGVRTMREQVARAQSRTRFAATLLAGFAAVALLLAALGVYGVLAQAVADRRRELGLRLALGAGAGGLRALVLRQGLALALAGTAVGLPLAALAARVLESQVYGVSTADPATFAAVPVVVLVAAALACWLPAWRAGRLDPATVLREE